MNRNKNALKSLLLILAFVVSLFAGAPQALGAKGIDNAREMGGNAWAKGQQGQEETVQFVAINDFHGNVLETYASSPSSNQPGLAKIAGVLNEMREEMPTFFFSAGDNFQGTAISNLTHGEVVNEAFELMDPKASAIGNHEYDWGKDMMYDWAREGGYPFLAANIVYKDSGEPVNYAKPYMIQKVKLSNGKLVKIGVIGIATPETATKTMASNVADIEFTDPVAATNQWVDYLLKVKKVDAIVALTHLGGFQAKDGTISGEVKDYAMGVHDVDLIFSGHTHATIDGVVNGAQILQARYNGRSLQVAELTFNNWSTDLVAVDGYVDPINLRQADLPVDAEVHALISSYEEELAPILNEVVGENLIELSHDTAEGLTPMGQWTAKTLAEIGNTDVAIVNGGGIRGPLYAGTVTVGDMYAIFPFDNTLVTATITGTHLRQLIEHGVGSGLTVGGNGFRDGQFYGVEITVDMTKPYGSRITSITVGGEALNPTGSYSVSTLDFLITGGDKYPFAGATNIVDTFLPVRELLIDYIRDNSPINYTYGATAYVVE